MSEDIAIRVNNLTKIFKLPKEKNTSFKSALISWSRRNVGYELQNTLKDVSFEINKGEFFAIVGRNGSGKSTLLKLLAGIYAPTAGNIQINGSLTPFIELGVGFNPELTGRENVYLNGALLGFNRREMSRIYREIVEFSELGRFMNQKLKNYSSGMQVRLAFSIAIRAQSDILLIDEVLAVGDAAFQRKCFDYFMTLKKNKKTVVLVTHDMSAARLYCDRGILLEDSKIMLEDNMEKIAQAYQRIFNYEIAQTTTPTAGNDLRWGSGKLCAREVKVTNGQEIKIEVKYKALRDLPEPVFGFNIFNSRGMNLLEGNTIREEIKTQPMNKGQTVNIIWQFTNMLATDTYTVSVSCCNQNVSEFYDWLNEAAVFTVSKRGNTAGFTDPPLKVKYSLK